MIRLVLATMVAALPLTCGSLDRPGQVDYRATLTLINRTERDITLFSQNAQTTVAACQEVTLNGISINSWQLASPGREMIHSGGGHGEPHSYLIVSGVANQVAARPAQLPLCIDPLQPAG